MGLFGKGKKKQENSAQLTDAFASFGYKTNTPPPPGRESRKDQTEAMKRQQVAQAKKANVLDLLTSLRKKLYSDPENDAYVTTIEEAISKLKTSDDSVNDTDTLLSVDGFLADEVAHAIDYANRGNYNALRSSIREIKVMINDRYRASSYYKNPEYVKCRLARNDLYAQQQAQQSRLDEINASLRQLKADSENPKMHMSKNSVLMEAQRLQDEGKELKEMINDINVQIQNCESILRTYEKHDISHSTDSKFNMMDHADDAIALKHENDSDVTQHEKIHDKFHQQTRKPSTATLAVDDTAIDTSTSTELPDDIFKEI